VEQALVMIAVFFGFFGKFIHNQLEKQILGLIFLKVAHIPNFILILI